MEENLEENLKEKIFANKGFSKASLLTVFLANILILVLILGTGIGFAWYYRADLFNYFASEYLKENEREASSNTFSQEYAVIETVRKASPAVVAIVLSKNVPTYELVPQESPFSQIFPGFPDFFFNTPEYQQKGTEKREVGSGSGFLISEDGLIVTNKHVVDKEEVEYTVFTNDGEKHEAEMVDLDPLFDIAILKINFTTQPGLPEKGEEEEKTKPPFSNRVLGYPFLSLGDSDDLAVGQSVIAIGNALGEFRNTVSVGIVSGLARSIVAGDLSGKREILDQVIQTDAAINPGNSGGPLLDLSGKVIGVNVAIAQGSQNVGFALPINLVKGAIESVQEFGRIIRPFLGIRYVYVDEEVKIKEKLSVDYGILVKRGASEEEPAVVIGSPADKAGILENDVVLEIEGEKITSASVLSSMIRKKKVGEAITLLILRGEEEKTIIVTLEEANR